jgi:hypothetical protein
MSAQPIKLSWSLTSQVELFEPPAHRRKVGVGQSTDGLTRCSSAGCEWCAATQRRSASVISSSSGDERTSGPPTAPGAWSSNAPRAALLRRRPASRERQPWKAEPRRDHLVRLGHSRARPDQLTRQGEQTPAVTRVQPLKQWICRD